MIVVTGATGNLGRLVVQDLLTKVPASQIAAAVRTPAKANDLAAKGVQVRTMDYAQPESLASALHGATRLLLVSGNELGKREAQHKAVIDSAKAAGVQFVAYTSILHCDTSRMLLAKEHNATEHYLRGSGLKYSMLRNGWYFENQTAALAPAIEHGVLVGCSGNGKFAAAARADFALAAANVLASSEHDNTVYELAGDTAYTRADLAAEVSKQTGKNVVYKNLPEAEYEKILNNFLPPDLAHVIADSDTQAASGELDDTSRTLSKLIGRPTTSLAEAVASALKNPPTGH